MSHRKHHPQILYILFKKKIRDSQEKKERYFIRIVCGISLQVEDAIVFGRLLATTAYSSLNG